MTTRKQQERKKLSVRVICIVLVVLLALTGVLALFAGE